MNLRGFGCFTVNALIAGFVTLVLIGSLWLISGGRMFSSGALNAQAGAMVLGGVQSHAKTGGKCGACHVSPFGKATMDERCLACHTDIPSQLKDQHSLHGILTSGKNSFSCRDCHIDHRGATASLTLMTNTNFPHQLLGYSLQAHKKNIDQSDFKCNECHPNGLTKFDVTECTSCHQSIDPVFTNTHTGTFGTNCLACHDGLDTYGKNFSHASEPFPLTGKHQSVDCGGCHLGARSISDLRITAQNCNSCHAKDDAHAGQLGTDCGACHTTLGWIPATFDHSKSRFPLTGAHSTVACQNCHVNHRFAGTPTDCYSCHAKDDAHQGQFGTDCSLCHTTTAWLPATFDHAKTGFALTGAHASLKCTQCHINNVFKGTPTACVACHTEPGYHMGLFGVDCAACHSTSAWSPAKFNGPHTFPLNHGGAGACSDCHPDTLTGWTCYAGCHAHSAAGIAGTHQAIADFSNCISCHPSGTTGDSGGGG